MNIDEIRKMVADDILMDKSELDIESIKTPQLHNKYLVFHTDEKLVLGKMQSDLNILKTDIEKFMDSDTDIIKSTNRILLQKEKVNYLENVIKIINNRQWSIRSIIDWIKFTHGT